MKKTIVAGLAFGSLVAPSMAADLYVKAPRAPLVCEWCGFYIGVNAGLSVGVDSYSTSISGFPTGFGLPNNPFISGSDTRALPGGMVGGQIGYNWQAGSFVYGAEVDWDWSGEHNSSSMTVQDLATSLFTTSLSDSERINSLGTARARVGWTYAGWLWYVTGGFAWAQVNDTLTASTSIPAVTFPAQSISFSNTRTGGTVGAGVETRLGGGWSAKLEYLYVGLGSVNNNFTTAPTAAGTFATLTSTHDINDHIVRIGLNYKFW
jgi:outer membrane immunogenic protein